MAGAEVDRLHAGAVEDVVERLQMAHREVDHVDVVAHAGAVVRLVVVAVDGQVLELAGRHLRDVGQEVVGDAVGVLAEQAAFVRADGVEVAQQRDAPRGIGLPQIGEDLLDIELGGAVGVGGRVGQRHILAEGDGILHAVDGGGGGEDDLFAAVRRHHFAEDEGAGEVVVIVAQRNAAGFANRLEPREMDDRVNLVLLEHPLHPGFVEQVGLVEFEVLAGNLADAFEGLGLRVDEIVQHNDFLARVQQLHAGVGTDIAGASGD